MKNRVKLIFAISVLYSTATLANGTTELQNRLNKISSFHATFTQKVTDAENKLLQSGEGELSLKRPNLFNWHLKKPDESLIISDGKTLWFYNPFVEQVSASWLKDAANDTPLILIVRNQAEDWKKYQIKQNGDHFVFTPVKGKSNIKQFTLDVTADGAIKKFASVELDGQKISYSLQNLERNDIESSRFTFTPPSGVSLDDERH